ncbi:hypothetical protein F2P81_003996 [Scophthalmus maximus]|uniref:Uncharacterized protein n=1 Tax=Scophthalmus maximus TaxID=52904 RepID=A0A6A4TK36_SCOMX|nr:hypothetical protein F2P81_003996 [Scophthalmus maximus]
MQQMAASQIQTLAAVLSGNAELLLEGTTEHNARFEKANCDPFSMRFREKLTLSSEGLYYFMHRCKLVEGKVALLSLKTTRVHPLNQSYTQHTAVG